jgi:hypothetical protein
MDNVQQFIPLIIPLVLIQLVLMVTALLDLRKRDKTRGPKWMWILIIIFGELIGPIVYFTVGRLDE